MANKPKNPFPKNITLKLAFDVSTSKTGVALLLNDKPVTFADQTTSLGQINMVEQEEYQGHKIVNGKRVLQTKHRDKKYALYGNRMFWGSRRSLDQIKSVVYRFIQPVEDYLKASYQNKDADKLIIDKVLIGYETSEISKNPTTMLKLALYVGAVEEAVASIFDVAGNFIKQYAKEFKVKLITPGEWQNRVLVGEFQVPHNAPSTKPYSVARANTFMEKWGYAPISIAMNDMADAINIADQLDIVDDSVVVKRYNNGKKISNTKLRAEATKLKGYINDLLRKVNDKKSDHIIRIAISKKSKYDLKTEKAKAVTEFMTSAELEKYNRWMDTIQNNEAIIIKANKMKGIQKNAKRS